jgi:hypothetical protein
MEIKFRWLLQEKNKLESMSSYSDIWLIQVALVTSTHSQKKEASIYFQ